MKNAPSAAIDTTVAFRMPGVTNAGVP